MFWNSTQWSLKACKKALRVSINSNTPTVAQIKTKMPTTRIIVLLYLHWSRKHSGLMHQITNLLNGPPLFQSTTKELTPRPKVELCHRKHWTTRNELSWIKPETKERIIIKEYDLFEVERFTTKGWGKSILNVGNIKYVLNASD